MCASVLRWCLQTMNKLKFIKILWITCDLLPNYPQACAQSCVSGIDSPNWSRSSSGANCLLSVNPHEGLNKVLGHKADHAKAQAQKNDEGAKFPGLGFPGQLSNDEQHVNHERTHAKGKPKGGDLFF